MSKYIIVTDDHNTTDDVMQKSGKIYFKPPFGEIVAVSGHDDKILSEKYDSITVDNETITNFHNGSLQVEDFLVRTTLESPDQPVLIQSRCVITVIPGTSFTEMAHEMPDTMITARTSIDRVTRTLVVNIETKFEIATDATKDQTLVLFITKGDDITQLFAQVKVSLLELARERWVAVPLPVAKLPENLTVFYKDIIEGMWFDATETAGHRARLPIGSMAKVKTFERAQVHPDYPSVVATISDNELTITKYLGGGAPILSNIKQIPILITEKGNADKIFFSAIISKKEIDGDDPISLKVKNIPNRFDLVSLPIFHNMVIIDENI